MRLLLLPFVFLGFGASTAHAQAQRYLPGHQADVFGIAFTPDGKTAVTCSDKETNVWSTESWTIQKNWALQSTLIATSPDGNTFYFNGPNIGLAEPNGEQLKVGPMLSGSDAAELIYLTQTRDNLRLGAGDRNGVVYVVDPAAKKVLVKIEAHPKQPILALAFSHDGKLIATSGKDNQTKIWDTATGKLVQTMAATKTPNRALSFSADGKRLAGCTNEAESQIWDAGAGTSTRFALGCMAIDYSGDGKYLALASDGVYIFDANTLQLMRHFGRARHAAARFSPNSRFLVSSSGKGGDIRVFDMALVMAPQLEKQPELSHGFGAEVSRVRFSPNGKLLVAGGNDYWLTESHAGITRVFNVQTTAVERLLDANAPKIRTDGAGNVVSFAGGVNLIDPATGKVKKSYKTPEGFPGEVQLSKIDISADGKQLVGLSKDHNALVWDLTKGTRTASVATGECDTVVFAPSGKMFALACADATVKIFSSAGKELQSLPGHAKAQYAVAFSKNGKLIASGGADGVVRVDDVQSGKNVLEAPGEKLSVTSVAFDPKGELIAFGSTSATVHVWSIKEKKELFSKMEHTEDLSRSMAAQVNDVTFSPDGKLLASASSDTSINLWDPKTGKVLRSISGYRLDTGGKAELSHTENQLFVAVERASLEDLKTVLALKPNIDVADDGKTPLITAVVRAKGNPVMVDALLNAGANPDIDDGGYTPLIIAASMKDLAVAKSLLAHKANPDKLNGEKISALVFAIQQRQQPMVEALIAGGANVNLKGGGDRTPLMQASAFGNAEAISALLAAKADVNAVDAEGHTALFYANMKQKTGSKEAKDTLTVLAAAGAEKK